MIRHARTARIGAALVAAAIVLAGCGDMADPYESTDPTSKPTDVTTTTNAGREPTSTTDAERASSTSAGTGAPGASASKKNDFDGERFDFGSIIDVEVESGATAVIFDRYQLYTDDGSLESGKDFSEEPIVFGNTDVPYVNDSSRTRRFVVAADAEVLRIADPVPCASDEVLTDPVWEPITLEALAAGAWTDRAMDSLTFSPEGEVTRIRLSTGC